MNEDQKYALQRIMGLDVIMTSDVMDAIPAIRAMLERMKELEKQHAEIFEANCDLTRRVMAREQQLVLLEAANGEAREAFKNAADRAYCESLQKYSSTECLGWEQKIKSGQFGKAEMEAHRIAAELMGAHRGIYKVLNAIEDVKP